MNNFENIKPEGEAKDLRIIELERKILDDLIAEHVKRGNEVKHWNDEHGRRWFAVTESNGKITRYSDISETPAVRERFQNLAVEMDKDEIIARSGVESDKVALERIEKGTRDQKPN